jgi:hypothetical protein
MSTDELTECAGCHRLTPTVSGRCPQCWHPKTQLGLPAARTRRSSVFDFDPFDLWSLSWIPVPLGLLVSAAGMLADSSVLIVVGLAVIFARLLGALIPWDIW